jgi:Asp-tRNA(Asn)/Glu-tRNA(Gln) amidotransferase A subunit family amidase
MPATTSVSDREALHYASLTDLARRIASREISPVAIAHHMLDRIAQVDANVKSDATVMHDQALADADAAEREIARGHYRSVLLGVPIAVKDLCCTKGVRTMGGTAVGKPFVPGADGDAAAMFDAIAGRDPGDPTSLVEPPTGTRDTPTRRSPDPERVR